MTPELKEKWVNALRSGEYEQGRMQLRSPENKYCCLGVLCDVSGLGNWGNRKLGQSPQQYYYGDYPSWLGLSDKIMKDLGIGLEQHRILTDMNDRGVSFDEISDYIESMVSVDE